MATTTVRTDEHRPSVIEPAEYVFVGILHSKDEPWELLAHERRRILEHIKSTGGTYSTHRHGGTCHICGAHATYLAVYYHFPSNKYIKVGQDCADKIDMEAMVSFRAIRNEADSARMAKAGKKKARQMLIELGLERAWILVDSLATDEGIEELKRLKAYSTEKVDGLIHQGRRVGDNYYEYWLSPKLFTLRDVIRKVIQYGNITEKQTAFVATLINAIDNSAQYEREQAERVERERAAAQDCPAGRVIVTGEVLSRKAIDTQFGTSFKMLVRDDRGFKIYGTIPGSLDIITSSTGLQRALLVGDRVTFTATAERSKEDSKFGFFKRPTKGACLTPDMIEE